MTDFQPTTPALFVGLDFRSGVSHYRTMLPAQALKASMFMRTADMSGKKQVGTLDAPVVIYSMPRSLEMFSECKQVLADPRRRLIIDVDDCMRAIVEDGEHPAAAEWAELVDQHEWLLSKADLVICATDWLAEYVRSLGAANVRVIPNALDIGRWNHKREPRHKEFTIVGFSGSIGHRAALAACAPALIDLLERRDDVALVSVGIPFGPHFPDELQPRIRDYGYFPIAQHPRLLTQFHINIGPTLNTDFYRAKSDLRAIEAQAADSVFIGMMPTYDDTPHIDHADTPESLVGGIEYAIQQKLHPALRKRAAKYVRTERLIEHTAPLWLDAIQSVLP